MTTDHHVRTLKNLVIFILRLVRKYKVILFALIEIGDVLLRGFTM